MPTPLARRIRPNNKSPVCKIVEKFIKKFTICGREKNKDKYCRN